MCLHSAAWSSGRGDSPMPKGCKEKANNKGDN